MLKALLTLALITPLLALAQNEDRIRAVETGLTPAVAIKGRPIPRYSLEERMKALGVNGVSIAVIRNYEIDWAKGYGLADVAADRAVTAETLFQAASISKSVTAMSALALVEKGLLKLDVDVNTYLKLWKVPENKFTKEEKVTLRRLLSHTAGLTVHGFPGYDASSTLPTITQILDGVKPANTVAVRVNWLPGGAFRYSGGGYIVVQLLMTEMMGSSFPDLMRTTVLEKLGMRQSTFDISLPESLAALAAVGYKENGDALPGGYHRFPELAAAGLWTTSSDLARFLIEIQKAREGRSNQVLSQSTVESMLKPVRDNYGLGFQAKYGPDVKLPGRDELKNFGHTGSNEGFQAAIFSTGDGNGFVVLTNSNNGQRLISEIRLAVAAAYGWPDNKPREREVITMTQAVLAKFAGEYDVTQIGRVTIRVKEDHLVALLPGQDEVALYPQSEATFFSLGGVPDIKFAANGASFVAGNITGRRVK